MTWDQAFTAPRFYQVFSSWEEKYQVSKGRKGALKQGCANRWSFRSQEATLNQHLEHADVPFLTYLEPWWLPAIGTSPPLVASPPPLQPAHSSLLYACPPAQNLLSIPTKSS